MDTFEAIKARRSVKHFDPTHKMTEEEIQTLFSSVLYSPSSFNLQHWRFVIVEDKALREQIKEKAWGQIQITDGSLLVIITGDLKAHEKDPARYWAGAPKEIQDIIVPMIGLCYSESEIIQRDELMRSSGIAAQTLMLTAVAMGYDSCPLVGFDFDAVGKLINLPPDHLISMMVIIGKALRPAHPRIGRLEINEVLIRDRF